jgi:hypothetical protein
VNEQESKRAFRPDSGTLLELFVFGADPELWQRALAYISANYLMVYSEDSVVTALPDMAEIFQSQETKSVCLEVLLPGFTVNAHFFCADEIEMNVLPEEIDSAEKAQALFQFMSGLASCLGKDVLMVPEYFSATEDELRRVAICIADALNGAIHFRPQ